MTLQLEIESQLISQKLIGRKWERKEIGERKKIKTRLIRSNYIYLIYLISVSNHFSCQLIYVVLDKITFFFSGEMRKAIFFRTYNRQKQFC